MLHHFGSFWNMLDHFRLFCFITGHFEQLWTIFENFGKCFTMLEAFWPYWIILDHFGPCLTMSDHLGTSWTVLENFGKLWTILDLLNYFGPRMSTLDPFFRAGKQSTGLSTVVFSYCISPVLDGMALYRQLRVIIHHCSILDHQQPQKNEKKNCLIQHELRTKIV